METGFVVFGPETVNVPEDPNALYGVNYSDIIPVLIKAIQEQQKQIEELTSKLKSSEQENSELQTLKAEVAEIKRLLSAEAKATDKK